MLKQNNKLKRIFGFASLGVMVVGSVLGAAFISLAVKDSFSGEISRNLLAQVSSDSQLQVQVCADDWVTNKIDLPTPGVSKEECASYAAVQSHSTTTRYIPYTTSPHCTLTEQLLKSVCRTQPAQQNYQGSIEVLYPNGGEILEVGKTYDIKWRGDKPNAIMRILLDTKETLSYPTSKPILVIATRISNSGSVKWTIPDIKPGNYYISMFCMLGDCVDGRWDNSNATFTIVAPSTINKKTFPSGFSVPATVLSPPPLSGFSVPATVLSPPSLTEQVSQGNKVEELQVEIQVLLNQIGSLRNQLSQQKIQSLIEQIRELQEQLKLSVPLFCTEKWVTVLTDLSTPGVSSGECASFASQLSRSTTTRYIPYTTSPHCRLSEQQLKRTCTVIPSIAVIYPNGSGSLWKAGQIQQISWQYSGDVKSVLLYLDFVNKNGIQTTHHIRKAIPGKEAVSASNENGGNAGLGTYNWEIPSSLIEFADNSTQFRVRIEVDGLVSGVRVNGDSSNDYFNIIFYEPSITVLSPNGGEVWDTTLPLQGNDTFSVHDVSWKTENYPKGMGVDINLFRLKSGWINGFFQVITFGLASDYEKVGMLANNAPNNESGGGSRFFPISPYYLPDGNYFIQVACPSAYGYGQSYGYGYGNTSTCKDDLSDNAFSIINPRPAPPASITVLSPNGGEVWETGNILDPATLPTLTWKTENYPKGMGVDINLFRLKSGWINGFFQVITFGLASDYEQVARFFNNTINNGSRSFNIPVNSVPNGDNYYIQVICPSAYGYGQNYGYGYGGYYCKDDLSDNAFSIINPPPTPPASITVLSPNGGEVWGTGGAEAQNNLPALEKQLLDLYNRRNEYRGIRGIAFSNQISALRAQIEDAIKEIHNKTYKIAWATEDYPKNMGVDVKLLRKKTGLVNGLFQFFTFGLADDYEPGGTLFANTLNDGEQSLLLPNTLATGNYLIEVDCPYSYHYGYGYGSSRYFPYGCKKDTSDAPFGIVGEIRGVLKISVAPAPPDGQTVIAGISQFVFAQYVLNASDSLEDMRLTSLPLAYNVLKGSPTDLTNCYLYDGSTKLNSSNVKNPSATDSSTPFVFDGAGLVITKGTIQNLLLKCNVKSASTGAYQWGYDNSSSFSAIGLTSGKSADIIENGNPGYVVTAVTSGALSISEDTKLPYRIVTPGQTVDLLRLKFTATNEDVDVKQLTLALSDPEFNSPDNLVNQEVTLWDGATRVGTAFFASGDRATSSALVGFRVPKGGSKVLTVKGRIAGIGVSDAMVRSGEFPKVDYDGGKGLTATYGIGVYSGQTVYPTGGATKSTGVRIMKSYPTVKKVPLTPVEQILVSGDHRTLYKFMIYANSSGDIAQQLFRFKVTSYPYINIDNFGLYVFKDPAFSLLDTSINADGLFNAGRCSKGLDSNNTVPIWSSNEACGGTPVALVIPDGQNRWFKLVASVSSLAAQGTSESLEVQMEGDAAYPVAGMQRIDGIGINDINNDFIWSPMSNGKVEWGTLSKLEGDWTNGYGVPGLPPTNLAEETISKSATGGEFRYGAEQSVPFAPSATCNFTASPSAQTLIPGKTLSLVKLEWNCENVKVGSCAVNSPAGGPECASGASASGSCDLDFKGKDVGKYDYRLICNDTGGVPALFETSVNIKSFLYETR